MITITTTTTRAAKAAIARLAKKFSSAIWTDQTYTAFTDGVVTAQVTGTQVEISSSYYTEETLRSIAEKVKGSGEVS